MLREAWTRIIRAEDYETHMAAVGQAQATAKLVAEYFQFARLAKGTRILFLGAGTGQMFDYVTPDFLRPYRTTFADINAGYLKWLTQRLKVTEGLHYSTTVDDVEQTQLKPGAALVIAVLLLEHVNWRKAVATMCTLSQEMVLVVVQQNPEGMKTALTPNRAAMGTMKIFQEVHPVLIPRKELQEAFLTEGFAPKYAAERTAAHGKKMVALGFEKTWK
jgi:hypothetical protein